MEPLALYGYPLINELFPEDEDGYLPWQVKKRYEENCSIPL